MMSQADISVVMKLRASTKQKVEITEKQKLERSASNAQTGGKLAANGAKFNLLHKKEENAKRF